MDASLFAPIRWAHDTTDLPTTIIAGPCSAETETQTVEIAKSLHQLGIRLFRASLWKPRTKPGGFEGVGADGIPWLERVRDELGMQVATEVATPEHVEQMLRAGFDTFWIGARTTTSPFAIAELASALEGTEVTLLVKNPINPDLALWEGALLRLHQANIRQIGAIHRGFSSYGKGLYRNSPYWQIPLELKRRYPKLTILCDPSHIGGKSELVGSICQTALEMNFDGLIIEAHPAPKLALSDPAQQLTPLQMQHLLQSLTDIVPTNSEQQILHSLRLEIDLLDEQLLHLLGERMNISRRIGSFKREKHMDIKQPQRYQKMLERRIAEGDGYGLGAGFIQELFDLIHQVSISEQEPKA